MPIINVIDRVNDVAFSGLALKIIIDRSIVKGKSNRYLKTCDRFNPTS